jgi:3D (Asp-Asp-Asp) domain-containing protein|nr:MAG TPA: 3D containing protein [Caudoviricetes sp.]
MKKLFMIMAVCVLSLWGQSADARMMEVSAYTHSGGVMANGEYPYVGAVASDDLPLGTTVIINGYQYVVADRFGGGYTDMIDIFVDTEDEAIQFGRQYLDVTVV